MAAAGSTVCLRLDKLPVQTSQEGVRNMMGVAGVEKIELQEQGNAGDKRNLVRLVDEKPTAAALQKVPMACSERSARLDTILDNIPSSSSSSSEGDGEHEDHPGFPPERAFDDACPVVRMRGLPFNATVEEIASLLHDVVLAPEAPAIVLTRLPDGRPTGDAYIHVANETALNVALGHHNDKMGNRYVQVFRASLRDMQKAGSFADTSCSTLTRSSSELHASGCGSVEEPDIGGSVGNGNAMGELGGKDGSNVAGMGMARTPPRSGHASNGRGGSTPGRSGGRGTAPADAPQLGPVVELRGLPFNATVDDIVNFFKGFQVKHHDVILPMRADPRSGSVVNTGYAHVTFPTRDDAARARQARHCAMMGNRYIECLSPSHYMMLPRHARQEEWRAHAPNGGGVQRPPGGWKGGGPYVMYGSPGPSRMPMMGPPMHGPMPPHEGPLDPAMLKQHPGAYMAPAPGSPMMFMPTPQPHGGGQTGSPTAPHGWPIPTTGAMHYPPSSPDSPQHGPPPPWFAGPPPPGPPPYGMPVPYHPMMAGGPAGVYYGSMSPGGGYAMGEGGPPRAMATPPKGGRHGAQGPAKGAMTPPTPQLRRNSSHNSAVGDTAAAAGGGGGGGGGGNHSSGGGGEKGARGGGKGGNTAPRTAEGGALAAAAGKAPAPARS